MIVGLHGLSGPRSLVVACLALVLCTSCRALLPSFVRPFAGSDEVPITRSKAAMVLIHHRVRPARTVTGHRELTRDQCRSLVLENNLGLQAARLEELTKEALADSSVKKMLPHCIFTGDLSQRNNLRYSYSDVLGQEGTPPKLAGGGTGVTSFSTGHERSTWTYVLETRWSLTDAALAYYVTRNSHNELRRSQYHKIRVAQKLVEQVDASFFRLLALQQCVPPAEHLVSLRQRVRKKAARLFEMKLYRPEDNYRAEQKAIRAEQFLSRLRNDLNTQRSILASVIGLSPDSCGDGGLSVVGDLAEPTFNKQFCEIELTAVQQRPEAYEAGLTHLSSINDVRRAIIKCFPRVSGFWRYSRDKDKYLYDKDWKEVGVQIHFDLMDWLANLDEAKAAGTNAQKTDRDMGAVALGVTAQARVAALKYHAAVEELRHARARVASSDKMVRAIESRYHMQDVEKMALEDARGDLEETRLSAIRVLGEANAALAELQSAMGINYQEPIRR